MKIILATAAIATGFSFMHGQVDGAQPAIDRQTTGSISRAAQPAQVQEARYVLSNPVSGSRCQMRRTGGTSDRMLVSPDRDCDSVWPGLSQVAVLSRSERGLHVLKTNAGHQILALGAGDGVAYEAVEPRDALVSVSEAR